MEIPEIAPKLTYKETIIYRDENLSEGSKIKQEIRQNITISKEEYSEIVKKHGEPLHINDTSPFMRDYLKVGFIVLRITHPGLKGTEILYFSSKNKNRIGKVYKLYI